MTCGFDSIFILRPASVVNLIKQFDIVVIGMGSPFLGFRHTCGPTAFVDLGARLEAVLPTVPLYGACLRFQQLAKLGRCREPVDMGRLKVYFWGRRKVMTGVAREGNLA